MNFQLILTFTSALLLSACTSVTLYDAGRDKAATDAKEAFAKVNFESYRSARRARMTRLRQEELAVVDRKAQLRGTMVMQDLVEILAEDGLFDAYAAYTSTCDHSPIHSLLCKLGIDSENDTVLLNDAYESTHLIFNIGSQFPEANLRRVLGPRTPTCADFRLLRDSSSQRTFRDALVMSAPEKQRDKIVTEFSKLENACAIQVSAFKDFATAALKKALPQDISSERAVACSKIRAGGADVRATLLSQAICRVWRADTDILATKASAAGVAARLKELAAETKIKPFDKAAFDKALDDGLKSVKSLLDGAGDVATLLGQESGANVAWFEAIGSLLTAAETGAAPTPVEEDSAGLRRARVMFASFKGIVRKTAEAGDAFVPLVPSELLIEHDFLRAEKSYLDKQIALLAAKRAVAVQELRAAMTQAFALTQAQTQQGSVCDHGHCNKTPVQLSTQLSGTAKRDLYVALAYAWLGLTAGQAGSDRIIYERAHLAHLGIVIERERALDETRVLAEGALDDLAAFHKTGLKREEIIALVGRLANLSLLGGIINATD